MHTRGLPSVMQQAANTQYDDIITHLIAYFSQKLDHLYRLGVNDVWLDPGFGFAKTLDQNYELLFRLGELVRHFPDNPVLTALSNKSMITKRLSTVHPPMAASFPTVPDSEIGTLALGVLALRAGTRLLRVHTPSLTRLAIDLLYQNVSSQ
jgi:dihydropteroate synthase